MLKYIFSLIFCGLLFNTNAQEFTIDPGHTSVTSKVVRFGMVKVLGRFSEVEGQINFDTNNPAKISTNVVIKTASYSSNNVAGEQAVKNVFLNTAQFPEMTFKSDKVENKNGQFTMFGKLTLHGVTKDIQFPFQLTEPFKDPTGDHTIAIHAMLSLNRQDYGIAFSRKLPNGEEFIGNEVEIELNVLAIEK